jgi:glycosyltransferase involved in cell wall biosynthesis
MKIAILGSRGIPAVYGGYDTLVEELSLRMVKVPSIEVMVYCRDTYYKKKIPKYYGVELVYLPTLRFKLLESLLSSFLSTINALGQDIDVIFFVDPANAPFCLLLRICGKKVVIHTDGLGWKRRKWGPMARRYYKFVEWLCAKTANVLVTDNRVMEQYYKDEYGAASVYIPYGGSNVYGFDKTVFMEYNLVPNEYLLVVARLEPENNTDLIIQEYSKTKVRLPLVIVGDSPYDPDYLARLKRLADERVYFTGGIYDQAKLNALYQGAYLYIHGHEVGGTNPSLLRAMNCGTAPVAINVPFNTSVINDSGYIFEMDKGHLCKLLEDLLQKPFQVKQMGQRAQERVSKHFTWNGVAEAYKQLFLNLTKDADKNYY